MTSPVQPSATAGHGLDPADWDSMRQQGRRMLDDMVDHLAGLAQGPVWRAPTPQSRSAIRELLPRVPTALATVHARFIESILPHHGGNAHPGFMGWVQGGGTPVGMLAEMLAAGMNANVGGRDHMAIKVERQVLAWTRELFGFPGGASGLFVTGASQANFMGVLIARTRALGVEVRSRGVGTVARLTAYTSAAAHGCIAQGMEMAGIGRDALRVIPVDADHRIRLDALQAAIARDRRDGRRPFLLVGTAGTVDIGAMDDLAALADLAALEGLHFHVDGALGALAMLAPMLAPRLRGIERADSLAFDWHKWGQVPYDAGFMLVRDGALQRATFATDAAYLGRSARGLAGGDWWPCDDGPDLSRGFRALKVWMTLKTYGADALGAVIEGTVTLAQRLVARIVAEPELELLAPTPLNIVCFGYRGSDPDRLNAEIVQDLHQAGRVAPSLTIVGGRVAIRAAIVNHRTGPADVEALVDGVLALGRRASSARTAAMTTAPPTADAAPADPALPERGLIGLARLARLAFEGADQQPIWDALVRRAGDDPADAAALMDLATMLLLAGRREDGLAVQSSALAISRVIRSSATPSGALRVLAIAGAGDLMTNTPLDFLLEGSGVAVDWLYVDIDSPLPGVKPPHDVAFLAIGESASNAPVLARLAPLLRDWPRPVVNGAAARIAGLTRDGVCATFAGDPHVLAPRTVRASHSALATLATGALAVESLFPGGGFPIIARPLDSHAGTGLSKLDDAAAVAAYLAERPEPAFYVAPFVDYRGVDGLYRKQRIAVIDGRPFASHMAVSEHWMVHYLNAGMAEDAGKRAEEALFMFGFDMDFAVRHRAAFDSLHRKLGLDYFAIDCAELADGRLLLFEADVAMIVHAMDSETLHPYKKPAMAKLFAAFTAALQARRGSEAVGDADGGIVEVEGLCVPRHEHAA